MENVEVFVNKGRRVILQETASVGNASANKLLHEKSWFEHGKY